jgi:hypothetical protein
MTSLFKEVAGSDRASFSAEYPFLFLFGVVGLQVAERSKPTVAPSSINADEEADGPVTDVVDFYERPSQTRSSRTILALALRKRQEAFANMITVGRAQNNDIVIPDISVSKFHAYFRVPNEGINPAHGRVQLCDSDSSNGTWLGDLRLPAKEAVVAQVGSVLRFGTVALTLVDAAQLWDRMHRLRPLKPNSG